MQNQTLRTITQQEIDEKIKNDVGFCNLNDYDLSGLRVYIPKAMRVNLEGSKCVGTDFSGSVFVNLAPELKGSFSQNIGICTKFGKGDFTNANFDNCTFAGFGVEMPGADTDYEHLQSASNTSFQGIKHLYRPKDQEELCKILYDIQIGGQPCRKNGNFFPSGVRGVYHEYHKPFLQQYSDQELEDLEMIVAANMGALDISGYSTFPNMGFAGCNFAGGLFVGTQIFNSVLRNTDFRAADLREAVLYKVDLDDANLSMVNITNGHIADSSARRANFENAVMLHVDLLSSDVTGARWNGADLRYMNNDEKAESKDGTATDLGDIGGIVGLNTADLSNVTTDQTTSNILQKYHENSPGTVVDYKRLFTDGGEPIPEQKQVNMSMEDYMQTHGLANQDEIVTYTVTTDPTVIINIES